MPKSVAKSAKQKPRAKAVDSSSVQAPAKKSAKKPSKVQAVAAPPPAPPVTPVRKSQFSAGERITHHHFGPGVVMTVAEDKLEIKFKAAGVKWILDSFVKAQ